MFETPSFQVSGPHSPAPDTHAPAVTAAFSPSRPRGLPLADAGPGSPHRPVTSSAPGFRAHTLFPHGPRLLSRLPQRRGCHGAATPDSARQAHPGAGGAGNCSQSKSWALRPVPVTWRLWARAPHVASQEETSVGRPVSPPSSTRVSIRSPPGQAKPGTSLPALAFPPGQRGEYQAVPLPARPALIRGAAASRVCGERTSYCRHACARRPESAAAFKTCRGDFKGGAPMDGACALAAPRPAAGARAGAVWWAGVPLFPGRKSR